MTRISGRNKGWLDNFFAQAIWGTGGIAISLVDKALPSTLLVGIRHGIGSFMLGVSILKNKRHLLRNSPWAHLVILGILGGALPDLLLVGSIRRCGPIVGVLLARLEIPLGVLFAHIFLKERVTAKAYIASAVAMLGACMISYKRGESITLQNSFYIGVVIGLAAGVVWALTSVYAKFILNKQADPMILTSVRLGIGSISAFVAAAFLVTQPLHILQQLSLNDWLLLIYLGVFVSGLAYLLFYKSLQLIDVHVAQILVGMSIAVVVILGLAIGVPISPIQWLGIALIAYSIYLIKSAQPVDD